MPLDPKIQALIDQKRAIRARKGFQVFDGSESSKQKEQLFEQGDKLKEMWREVPALFMAQVIGLIPYDFQLQMLNYKGVPFAGRQIQGVLAPRDSGKSEIGTIGDAVQEIAENPNMTGQIAAESRETACVFLDGVKQHFEDNDILKTFYGNHVSGKWSATRIVSSQRNIYAKEPTLQAIGAGGAAVGRHVDIQWYDDVVSQRNSDTDVTRRKLVIWHDKTMAPILKKGGKLKIRGTRWYPRDLYWYLADKMGRDIFLIISALYQDEDGVEHSYCPERYPLGDLFDLRRKDPISFATQYLNRTDVMQGNLVDRDKLIFCKESEIPPVAELEFYIGIDPASSTKRNSNLFALVVAAYHKKTGIVYVLRVVTKKLADPIEMLNFIKEEHDLIRRQYGQVYAIGLESGGPQSNLYNLALHHPAEYGLLPIIEVVPSKDKEQRLHAVSYWFNLERVRFTEQCYQLVMDVAAFPDVDDGDDRVDALVYALMMVGDKGVQFMGVPTDYSSSSVFSGSSRRDGAFIGVGDETSGYMEFDYSDAPMRF